VDAATALDLADFRRRTLELHLAAPADGPEGLAAFRRARDALFASHPSSPLTAAQRARFAGVPYFSHAREARVVADLEPPAEEGAVAVDTGGEDGPVRLQRVARVRVPAGELTLFWLLGYGGGLFLPFRDATAGTQTYGGGRYLTDTIKGTWGRGLDLVGRDRVVLDFNYAYNPSCAYNSAWACPLAPPENRLEAPVRAGELTYPDPI
jgi:uncharacterized protein (DUF1684 family)